MLRLIAAPHPGRVNVRVVVQSLIQKFLFLVLSFFVIVYALGYRINYQTHTIQQTGLIYLNTQLHNFHPHVTMNGEDVSGRFPYRLSWLFPDTYTVTVSMAGYQDWQRIITVDPNKAYPYAYLFLVENNPKELQVTPDFLDQLNTNPATGDGLVVHENELRANGVLLTRTSADIHTAVWYPDNHHIVYQAGKQLLLADMDGRGTENITTLSSEKTVRLAFAEKGRILLYSSNGIVHALELFEAKQTSYWPPTDLVVIGR